MFFHVSNLVIIELILCVPEVGLEYDEVRRGVRATAGGTHMKNASPGYMLQGILTRLRHYCVETGGG